MSSDSNTGGENDHRQGIALLPVNHGKSATGNSSNPYKNESLAYEDESVVENQGRLRRLFSFIQLLAFALTFMSSWEVIAM